MKHFPLNHFIDNLSILEPIFVNENIVLLPIESKLPPNLLYISLIEASKNNEVEIKEINDAGSVTEIFIKNKSKNFILIPQGETLIGAKQNRIVNTSILIEPNCKTKIPVSCIEQGRWRYTKPNFKPANEMIAYKLRKFTSKSLYFKMRDEDSFDSDQRKIWDFIESDFNKDLMDSPTLSYTDYMEEKLNSSEIEISKIELPSGINGFATFFGDKIFSLEYFSNPNFFSDTKDRLLKAILVDAQDYNYVNVEGNEFTDYKLKLQLSINDFLNLNPVRKKSIGAGIDYKAYDEQKDLHLSYLIYKEELIHMVFYY